jgi:hypothetical protein
MPIERWATFAVNDHLQDNSFVADVLLYDKLVVPYPPPDDSEELKRWQVEEWSPAWLDSLREILGDLVEPVPWNEYRRSQFSDRWKSAEQAGEDAYATTRMMLKQEFTSKTSEAGNPVRPVVAFQSERELQRSVQSDVRGGVERLGMVFKHKFFVPDSAIESHTDLLRRAVDLARDAEFINARRALYDWQEGVIAKGYTDEEAVGVMRGLLGEYERVQRRAKWKSARFAFFVVSLAVPVLREYAVLSAGAALAAEGGIKVVEYARESREGPPSQALEAAAAIHTVRRELSLKTI